MSILDNLKDIFSDLITPKANTFVGIDIGASYIKIVQLKRQDGRILLETYGEVALGPYQKDGVAGQITSLEIGQIVGALQNLLTQANVTAKQPIIAISSSTSLIFILKLPQISERELSGVVENEARKYIPVPLTEVSLDWWMIPEQQSYSNEDAAFGVSKQTHIDVLVAAVRNEIVSRYNTIAQKLKGLDSPRYEIETFSAVRAAFKHELAPVMLIDFGASGMRMSVVEHGVIRKFRAINRGSAYLTSSLQKSLEISFEDAEKLKREVGLESEHQKKEAFNIIDSGVNYMFTEIKNVIFDFEKEYKKPINKIILTGGGSLLKNFKEQVESRYNITTMYADPFSKALAPDFLDGVLEKAGPEFAIAVGLALQGME
jgi:type IV pilus assembly protein PilM